MAEANKIAGITVARQQPIDESSDPSRGKWSSPFRLRAGNLSVGLMRVNKNGGENKWACKLHEGSTSDERLAAILNCFVEVNAGTLEAPGAKIGIYLRYTLLH